jgi:hypothetical protein
MFVMSPLLGAPTSGGGIRLKEVGGCSGISHSHIHEEAGAVGIHPNVSTALLCGLVCYVAFAQVPETGRDFDVRKVVVFETSIGVVRLDFHSFLSSGGCWRGIRRWREVRSHQWFALYSNIKGMFRSDGVTNLVDDSVPDMVVPADI